jgi:hypothetical protein
MRVVVEITFHALLVVCTRIPFFREERIVKLQTLIVKRY